VGALVDLQHNQVGRCYPFGGHFLDCGLDPVGRVVGPRKLRCELNMTAGDINKGRPV
jgi:hypothetical protein